MDIAGSHRGDKPATQLVSEADEELLEDPIERLLKQHLPHGHISAARQGVSRAASATAAWAGSALQDMVGWRGPAHQGASPHGFWGEYLCAGEETFRRLVSTVMGFRLVSRRRSDSTLWWGDSVLMCSRFSRMHLMIFGTWRRHS